MATLPHAEKRLLLGRWTATETLQYVAPVGEKQPYVERALAAVTPYLPAEVLA